MKFRSFIFLFAAILISTLPVKAASDFLLVLDGIPGESVDAKYPGSIEVQSFGFGVSNVGTISGGGGGAGKATFSDISFTKSLDKASPQLYLHCASGKHIRSATLYVRKAGGDKPLEYYVVKLTDLLVTSVQTSGSTGSGVPMESFSLNYAKIEFIYTPQKPDGSADTPVRSGWDLKLNLGF
jgi:type VI secretion system secreted protein Hcp